MIKTSLFLRGPVDGAFDPFVLSGAAAAQTVRQACPHTRGCTLSRSDIPQLDADSAPPFAGVLELWFEQPQHALDAQTQPGAFAPLLHEGASIAHAVSGHERIVMRLPEFHHTESIKAVFPFKRKPGMSVREFQDYWWQQHGPIAAQTERALCYTQCHPFQTSYKDEEAGGPDFDGITELFWRTTQDAEAAMASRQMREDQSTDAGNFADRDSVMVMLTRSEPIIPT